MHLINQINYDILDDILKIFQFIVSKYFFGKYARSKLSILKFLSARCYGCY